MESEMMKIHMEIKQLDKMIEKLEEKREKLFFKIDQFNGQSH